MLSVERQIGIHLGQVGISHVVRYLYALSKINPGDKVLDVFCGTGYGARMMGELAKVTAFDKCGEFVAHKNVEFITATYTIVNISGRFNLITCFEAIEHVPRSMARNLMKDMMEWLEPDGTILISSPNQIFYPFDKYKIEHHFFHYTPKEMEADLKLAGLDVIQWKCQKSKGISRLEDGTDGRYMIAEVKKV